MKADPHGVLTGTHFIDGDHACCDTLQHSSTKHRSPKQTLLRRGPQSAAKLSVRHGEHSMRRREVGDDVQTQPRKLEYHAIDLPPNLHHAAFYPAGRHDLHIAVRNLDRVQS